LKVVVDVVGVGNQLILLLTVMVDVERRLLVVKVVFAGLVYHPLAIRCLAQVGATTT
jgi:hypothetical protein